ncbi:MAG: helix-turn-helix domain-containing protein [Oscillospiraceae bacterium]|nr:helix-turn-helix domain-containing protein [Oscillospiraceae bacterium]
MFSRKIFGERLKQLRIEKKARQFNLAELLNVTRTQISDIENGKTTTTIEKLWLLADYFDVTIDYLVGRSDDPKRR